MPRITVAVFVDNLVLDRRNFFVGLLAQHVFNRTVNRVFAHQLELGPRVLIPKVNVCKRDGDRPIAKWVITGRLNVAQIAPRYIHGKLIGRQLFRSKKKTKSTNVNKSRKASRLSVVAQKAVFDTEPLPITEPLLPQATSTRARFAL